MADVGSSNCSSGRTDEVSRRALVCNLQQRPSCHGDSCQAIESWRRSRFLTFTVDCKPLPDILNDYLPLKDLDVAPIVEKMTRKPFNVILSDGSPSNQISGLVFLQGGGHNRVANLQVNYAMEQKRDWLHLLEPAVPDFVVGHLNLICQTDGGTRAEERSAAAWTIEASIEVENGALSLPIAMSGFFFC